MGADTPEKPNNAQMDAWIRALGSWRRARRDAAARALQRLGPDAVEPLLEWLQKEEARSDRMTRCKEFWALPVGFAFLCSTITNDFLPQYHVMKKIFGLLLFIVCVFSCAYEIGVMLSESRRAKLICGILQYDDVRFVGPLLMALSLKSKRARAVVISTLKHLLPRLQASDRPLITLEHQRMLLTALDEPKFYEKHDAVFAAAALKALMQVGDEGAIHAVSAYTIRWGKLPEEREAKDLARECLKVLRERAKQEEKGKMLLRPASAPQDTLLRPAHGVSKADPDTLLRPASADTTEEKQWTSDR